LLFLERLFQFGVSLLTLVVKLLMLSAKFRAMRRSVAGVSDALLRDRDISTPAKLKLRHNQDAESHDAEIYLRVSWLVEFTNDEAGRRAVTKLCGGHLSCAAFESRLSLVSAGNSAISKYLLGKMGTVGNTPVHIVLGDVVVLSLPHSPII